MSEELLLRHCSPTLAGIKTGSVYNCAGENAEEINGFIRRLNGRLKDKGVRVVPLRYGKKGALLYVYRPKRLKRDLIESATSEILGKLGYSGGCENCVACLAKRVRKCEEFPHEIGLFLSYPPEDVKGFMEKGAAACKCCGCWKVYGDAKESEKIFCKFRNCTDIYLKCYSGGAKLEKLTVNETVN